MTVVMILFPGEFFAREETSGNSGAKEFLSSFFGDFFPFGGSRDDGHAHIPRGGDLVVDLYVSLEEVFNGNFIEVNILR